jgi:hypothetical protein
MPFDEFSQPNFKVVFLGTNRLPHCDYELYHSEDWGYSIDASGVFTGGFTRLNSSPFPINVGNSVVINNKYYTVSSINTTTGYITCTPSNPNDVLAQGSGSRWTLYNGCGINENYYTNESLKFGVSITGAGSANGYQVVGTPKLTIRFTGQNGTVVRYAEFKEEFSSYVESGSNPSGYFEFQYVVQGVDNGVPYIGGLTVDDNNAIRWKYGNDNSSQLWYQQFPSYTDMTRVRVNMDGSPSGKNNNQVTVLLKRSDVPGKAPAASDLILGEPALNTNDGKMFIKKKDNSIVEISPMEPQSFQTNKVTISADTNNLNLGSKALTRLSVTSSGLRISGFASGEDGEIKMIYNSGSNAVKILNESSNSTSGNRVEIHNSSDFDLLSKSAVTIVYDGTSGVWRLF